MAYVLYAANEDLSVTTVDVTLDVGSSANRKAIFFTSAQLGSTPETISIVRDPGGDDDAATQIRGESVLNGGDAYHRIHAHYMDLSVTGSQTFRATVSASSPRFRMGVLVWDGLASGAAEADEATSFTSAASSISDSITTLSANAVVFTGAIMRTSSNETAPWWTPDNSQTERDDAVIDSRVEFAVGDLVRATAGAQTMGWTGAASADIGIQILASFAAAGGGGSGNLPLLQAIGEA